MAGGVCGRARLAGRSGAKADCLSDVTAAPADPAMQGVRESSGGEESNGNRDD